MKLLRIALVLTAIVGLTPSALADTGVVTSTPTSTPTGVSTSLWQAYQDVAIAPSSTFPYQAVTNFALDPTPRNDKWYAAPNVIVTGAPNSKDLQNLKDFTASVAQSCTGMVPTYQTQIQTVITVASRGRVSTITTTTPNTYLMNFYYVPTAAFHKVSSALVALPGSATDAAIFNYDSAGNIYGTKSLLSTDQASQATRDLATKHYLLQALGLFGTTTNTSSNAFLAGNTTWDGTLSDFDRELISLHCSTAVPSYRTAPEIAASITRESSSIKVVRPTDTYNVLGTATETTAHFVISAPSIDNQIKEGVENLAYSVVDDSGTTIDSGTLKVSTELFRASWTLDYKNLNPYTTYTATVNPENSAGLGATTTYGLFTWSYGNL
jgi:hypothetical protein